MKKCLFITMIAVMLMSIYTIPVFAHGHCGRYQNYVQCENICEMDCEDGIACGVDGHYCSEHRSGETCEGYTECRPVYYESHHHRRHH
ncbi:MAG: hypothetical protein HFG56_10840 [Lachnospiraceae bacterium]|jgi:uncharacterized protein YxeA|nr:hypothetical protein [Lachnospiraceae bacterium]